MTSILLDPEIRKEFEKLLPKDKHLADALREYMQEVVTENQEKKGEALERLPIFTTKVRQTSILEYTINYIYNLVNTSDEILEAAIRKIPAKKGDLVYEKFGHVRTVLFDMDHEKC